MEIKTDKQWIQQHYLPELNGDVLYVGFSNKEPYVNYPNLINSGTFTTVDINPKANPDYLCDFTYEFKSEKTYDHISLHGLWGNLHQFIDDDISRKTFGHGRKADGDSITKLITTSIIKAHSLLNVGGTLQIGPNTTAIIPIYNSLVDNKVYEKITRIEAQTGNCIFWGKKLSNNNINFIETNNLWKK